VAGINDVAASEPDEWVTSSLSPTYISGTSFSVAGDQTAIFQVGRRVRGTLSGSTRYGQITGSSFGAGVTTVVLLLDSGALDVTLSAVAYGLLSATNSSVPSVPALVGGGLELLYSQDASASATIDFTANDHPRIFSGEFDTLLFELTAVKPSTDDVYLAARIGTGAGPTFQATGYEWGASLIGIAGLANDGSTTSGITTLMVVGRTGAVNGIGNAAGEYLAGRLWLTNPAGSDYPSIRFDGVYIRADGVGNGISAFGRYGSALAITGLRFLMSSGNIASGTFRVFGVKDA
jgi:hypothetical protein